MLEHESHLFPVLKKLYLIKERKIWGYDDQLSLTCMQKWKWWDQSDIIIELVLVGYEPLLKRIITRGSDEKYKSGNWKWCAFITTMQDKSSVCAICNTDPNKQKGIFCGNAMKHNELVGVELRR